MARAIWSGSISFGLLNVPVKLYSAVSRRQISFRELRESDSSRVRHKRVAEADGEEVAYEEIVKGYELAPDQYVVFSRDELEELDPKKTKAIEVEAFVDLDDIDPIYFVQPYYLGPEAGAERAYGLLVKAMADERKVAVARFVLRNKEHLAALRPMGDVLTLTTMRFADEIVPPAELDGVVPEELEKPKAKELQMAKQLVGSLTSDFDPDEFHDEYREELLGAHRGQGPGRGPGAGGLGGAHADQGARPDGRAGGEPRGRQGRAPGGGLEVPEQVVVEVVVLERPQVHLQVEVQERVEVRRQGLVAIAKQGQGREVEVDGRSLSLTNLDKVMWPKAAFTKGDAINYYARVAPALLPHLAGRPLTRVRYPNGVDEARFFEKRAPKGTPEWVRTAPIVMGREGELDFIVCDDLATLTWLGQLAALELHPSLSLADDPETPTVLVLDLDPGPPASIVECCQVALTIRAPVRAARPGGVPEDLGIEGPAAVLAAQLRGRLRRHEAVRPRARAGAGAHGAEAGALADEEGAPQGQGVRRLEPERPREDHRRRLLAARAATSRPHRRRCTWDEVEAAAKRRPGPPALRGRARCWSAWPSTATCSPRSRSWNRSCLTPRPRGLGDRQRLALAVARPTARMAAARRLTPSRSSGGSR